MFLVIRSFCVSSVLPEEKHAFEIEETLVLIWLYRYGNYHS